MGVPGFALTSKVVIIPQIVNGVVRTPKTALNWPCWSFSSRTIHLLYYIYALILENKT